MRALSIAATGMAAQQTNVDVISNNIANMNTIGYKKQEANFEDLLYEDIKRPGAQSSTGTVIPTGIQLGAGVETASVYRITSQGVMTSSIWPSTAPAISRCSYRRAKRPIPAPAISH
jgi:flagellar basal-body rod protein FlgG